MPSSRELLVRTLPSDPAAARAAIYAGTVFQLPPTAASRAFVDDARAEIVEAFGFPDIRQAHEHLPGDALFARVGAVRKRLYLEPAWHDRLRAVVASIGLDPAAIAFDPARLRVVAHRGHENPLARPVYYPHRDTWYAHPASVITVWIPLDDLAPDETFVFYPEAFARPIPNDSEIFDYAAWVQDGWSLKIGWQDRRSSTIARYPGVLGVPGVDFDPGPAVGFDCRKGEILLFAGAHFHATVPQSTGRTRFSLDFRVVDLEDARAGRGAPNVDDRSRGSCLDDYVRGLPVR